MNIALLIYLHQNFKRRLIMNDSHSQQDDQSGPPPFKHPDEFDFFTWFQKNNPLYLLSVLFMLMGLYLVGSELETGKISILTVTGFFAIQNLYEIAMIAMALYLLKNRIQSDHGKLLLVFVMVFLGDLTFYQVRISGMDMFAGNIVTIIYIGLALAKFYFVIRVLDLKIHRARMVYAFSAFLLIWTGPKVAYYLVDSVGTGSIGFFDGSYVYYSLWLIAGLIHLPLIVSNWNKSSFGETEKNAYLTDATPFWKWLMVFPFVVMPLQLYFNVMTVTNGYLGKALSMPEVILPWALGAAFFIQTIWQKECEDLIGLKHYDAGVLLVSLCIVMAFSGALSLPSLINYLLVITGLAASWLSRANTAAGVGLGFLAFWHTGSQLKIAASAAVNYGSGMTKTAWAALLMLGSFVMLGLGFLLSVGRGKTKDDSNDQPSDASQ